MLKKLKLILKGFLEGGESMFYLQSNRGSQKG